MTERSDDRVEEYARRRKRDNERLVQRRDSYAFAAKFWKLLVEKNGGPDAKEIMRHVMGDKKPGRAITDRAVALRCLISAYLLRFGISQTDGQIANRVFESSPVYLELESGAVLVANNEITEVYLSLADDPVVTRRPVDLSLSAMKKTVERTRRWLIEENFLPGSYAPRAYHRDQ